MMDTQQPPEPALSGHIPNLSPLSILCIDDDKHVLAALKRLFRTERFTVLTAASGKEGMEILKVTENISLILCDQRMPEMSGTAFLEAARYLAPNVIRMLQTGYADLNSAIAAINRGGVQHFIVKPWNDLELLSIVREGVQRYRMGQIDSVLAEVVSRHKEELDEWNVSLRSRVLQQTATLRKKFAEVHQQQARNRKINEAIIKKFADLQEQRHHRLGHHSRTVANLAHAMASTLNLSSTLREELNNASLLHDIGLLSQSDRVLSRNMVLMSPAEATGYRAHPVKGQELISVSEELQDIGTIIRHHHEEFDGSGYPDGLSGEQIPVASRIIHLADYIDHAYSREIGYDAKYQVTRKIAAEMRRRFDPALSTAAVNAVMEVLAPPQSLKIVEEREVSLAQLGGGMILSQDIFSISGTLLLERATRLDDTLIEALRRYHGKEHATTKVSVLK